MTPGVPGTLTFREFRMTLVFVVVVLTNVGTFDCAMASLMLNVRLAVCRVIRALVVRRWDGANLTVVCKKTTSVIRLTFSAGHVLFTLKLCTLFVTAHRALEKVAVRSLGAPLFVV